VAAEEVEQLLGELDLGRAGEEVGDVPQRAAAGSVTAATSAGVGVTERVDGDPAEQVDDTPGPRCPRPVAALTAGEGQLRRPKVSSSGWRRTAPE
jgi:hypothetical protein